VNVYRFSKSGVATNGYHVTWRAPDVYLGMVLLINGTWRPKPAYNGVTSNKYRTRQEAAEWLGQWHRRSPR
jgi:hypothetical protein